MKIPRKYFPHYARYKTKIQSVPTVGSPKRIVIISDTHISKGGLFNSEMFRKGIEEVNKIKNVDYIIHLGDLTQDGTYLTYEYALECLKSIDKEKFYIIPGNHDARNVGYLLFEEFFGGRTFQIDEKDIYILGIDSSIPDQDSGRIGKRIIDKSREFFLNNQEKVRIFCFHHQLIPIPLTGRERSAIVDGGDALKMILESNIDLVMNGHRHISNVYSATNGEGELVIFNSGTLSCNKTRYKELFTYTVLDIFEKALVFSTKKTYTGEEIQRGRYINRVFSPKISNNDKNLICKVIHIANTHFSSNMFNPDIYEKAVEQINAIDAEFVIHSGDVTNSNRIVEFKEAIVKLREIKHPMLIVPGNNDLMEIGWEIFPKLIGPLEPYYENENMRIIGINSVDNVILNGSVGRKKMRETINFFAEKPRNKINFITFYHNLIPHPKTRFDQMLSDSGNVLKFFTESTNKIHFILTGHDHIAFSLQLEDTIISSCGTLSSREISDTSGNTFSVIYCYDNGSVEIETRNISDDTSQVTGHYWVNLDGRNNNDED